MAAKDYIDPEGYWLDPDGNIRRLGDEDGEQEIIATVTRICSDAEKTLLCEALGIEAFRITFPVSSALKNNRSSHMDEGRKKTLWVCAAILASPRLAALEDGTSDALQAEITLDAIAKAERIIRQIDSRWPGELFIEKTPRFSVPILVPVISSPRPHSVVMPADAHVNPPK
jgi:hypothetical protein